MSYCFRKEGGMERVFCWCVVNCVVTHMFLPGKGVTVESLTLQACVGSYLKILFLNYPRNRCHFLPELQFNANSIVFFYYILYMISKVSNYSCNKRNKLILNYFLMSFYVVGTHLFEDFITYNIFWWYVKVFW